MDSFDLDEKPPLIFDFRIATHWGYNEQSPRQVVYLKRWQTAMRKDMQKMFGEEIEPNLYHVDEYFWDNPFERRAKRDDRGTLIEKIFGDYFPPENASLATHIVLYWARNGEQVQSSVRHLWGDGLNEEQREHAYLGWYASKNIPIPHINHGTIDDDWLIYRSEDGKMETLSQLFYTGKDFNDAVDEGNANARRANIGIRKMLRWLASDKGQEFIQSCERNIRIKYDREGALRYPEYSKSSPVQQWLSRRP